MEQNDRKKEITDAAVALINGQGIQELTMKRIAAAVGVSEPALYRHFASKYEILAAVVDELELSRAQALKAAKAAENGAENNLIAFFEYHVREFIRRPAMTIILFSEDLFRNDASLLMRVSKIIVETQKMIQEVIEQEKRAKTFRWDVDAESSSLMLLGGFRLLVSQWRLEHQSFDLAERTRVFILSAIRMMKA